MDPRDDRRATGQDPEGVLGISDMADKAPDHARAQPHRLQAESPQDRGGARPAADERRRREGRDPAPMLGHGADRLVSGRGRGDRADMDEFKIRAAEGPEDARRSSAGASGSGHGKTAGKGNKGQKARAGGGVRLGFEGGQMPLFRRIARRGFSNYPFKERLPGRERRATSNRFADGETVTAASLRERGLARKSDVPVKILGGGELTARLVIDVAKVSAAAREKIAALGRRSARRGRAAAGEADEAEGEWRTRSSTSSGSRSCATGSSSRSVMLVDLPPRHVHPGPGHQHQRAEALLRAQAARRDRSASRTTSTSSPAARSRTSRSSC